VAGAPLAPTWRAGPQVRPRYAAGMRRPQVALWAAVALAASGCTSGTGNGEPGPPPAPGGGPACGEVRLTHYTAGAVGWCEFHRTLSVLPASVRSGMTFAIAEPWNGGSYGGVAGEACGECWELDTISGTQVVMVHDLCPIEGNPLCAGGFFHFDLASEAAAALGSQGLDEGSARRVACPVTGNAYLEILDRNDWYLRFQVVNQRVPVRQVDYRAATGGAWRPVTRSGGAWDIPTGSNDVLGPGAPGGVFRITSAQGQILEMPNALGYGVAKGSTFDLGAQLSDLAPGTGPACVFTPPAAVYVDGYGGIDQVRWQMDAWGNASASETTSGCASGSCIRVQLAPWDGFHIYYRQAFATSTFSTLSLKVKAASGSGTVSVSAGLDGATCSQTSVTPGKDWSAVDIDLASTCAGVASIDQVTVQATSGSGMALLLDDVRFGK